MEKEQNIIKMEKLNMKVNFKMENMKDMVNIFLMMISIILVYGKMT